MRLGDEVRQPTDECVVGAVGEPGVGELAPRSLVQVDELVELVWADPAQFAGPSGQLLEAVPLVVVRRNERIDVQLGPTVVVT